MRAERAGWPASAQGSGGSEDDDGTATSRREAGGGECTQTDTTPAEACPAATARLAASDQSGTDGGRESASSAHICACACASSRAACHRADSRPDSGSCSCIRVFAYEAAAISPGWRATATATACRAAALRRSTRCDEPQEATAEGRTTRRRRGQRVRPALPNAGRDGRDCWCGG